MATVKQPSKRKNPLEEPMQKGVTGMLNGRAVTLGYYPGVHKRIGWVWKDTGLPANMENKDEH